jgi:hypothetical protein
MRSISAHARDFTAPRALSSLLAASHSMKESRTIARRQPEQARRLVLRTLPQHQFAAVEIGLADLTLFLAGTGSSAAASTAAGVS